jgi:hypothetical protein
LVIDFRTSDRGANLTNFQNEWWRRRADSNR